MTKQFDFDQIGKKVPYRVPEGFFEEMQREVLARTVPPRRRRPYWRIVSALLGAAAVVAAVVFIPRSYPEQQEAPLTASHKVESDWVEQLPDDELKAMDDFADYDLFMN